MRDFERRGIRSPRGHARWSTATARSFEQNLPAYLGHLVYGQMNERLREGGLVGGKKRGFVGGQSRRPAEEWTVHRNAHPALITPDTAAKVQARLRERGVTERRGTAYLLSGILVCALCGQHYVGSRSGARYIYRCLTRCKRGQTACANNDLAREPIEAFAIQILRAEFLREERIADLVARLHRRPLAQRRRAPIKDAKILRDDLESLDQQRQKAVELYTKGKLNEEELDAVNARLRARHAAVKGQLDALEAPLQVDFRVNVERLRAFVRDMDAWMREGDVVRRKTLLRNVYREMRLWPKVRTPGRRRLEVTANLDELTRAFVVSPTGFDVESTSRWTCTRTLAL